MTLPSFTRISLGGGGGIEKCPLKATLEKFGSFEMPTLQIIV